MKLIKYFKNNYIKFVFFLVICSSFFTFSYAKTFKEVLTSVSNSILKPLVPIIIGLAVVFFAWGVIKFIKNDGKDKEEGKQLIFWGVIGLFVMISVWALVAVVGNTLRL